MDNNAVEIVDVAPRDGFQSVKPYIPTPAKAEIVRALLNAGVKRVETGSFVSPKAVPQLADTAEVHQTLGPSTSGPAKNYRLPALIANARGGARALAAGVSDLVYVFSVSETHNRANVRKSVAESVEELKQVIHTHRGTPGFRLRVNVATAFDCPYAGRIDAAAVMPWLDAVMELARDEPDGAFEFGICDTTGRAFPDQVGALFEQAITTFGTGETVAWAFHGHDTFGLGVANALAAHGAGVRVFDAAAAGLGGCPFAPGATGNTATEDLVFTFENMGITTGIDIERLLAVADTIAALPGARVGGHLRGVPRQRVLA
ncbi:MAG: hydroxymethylglutaryl-CoA lyase [Gammaproteobacteria bacterium]|nr:hydroxymethylglutaryl-CoA lyase [Gammaproteobacteria bacterium]